MAKQLVFLLGLLAYLACLVVVADDTFTLEESYFSTLAKKAKPPPPPPPPRPIPPAFVENFNIGNEVYGVFIERMKTRLTNTLTSRSHHIPILPPQSSPPSFMDVSFTYQTKSITARITVRFYMRNLYVIGYTRADGRSFQFSDSSLMPGVALLPYSGGYVCAGSVGAAAGRLRQDVFLSSEAMKGAVNGLSTKDSKVNKKDTARALLTIIQMLAEGLRFKRIAEHIKRLRNEILD